MDVMDEIGGKGAQPAKFEKVGDFVEGTVLEMTSRQATEYHADGSVGKPLFWPDGKPEKVVIFTLQTNLNDGTDEDDGRRAVWARYGMQLVIGKAIRKELGQKCRSEQAIGGRLKVVYVKDERVSRGTQKVYGALYAKPDTMAEVPHETETGDTKVEW